jgi:hypothetical protein
VRVCLLLQDLVQTTPQYKEGATCKFFPAFETSKILEARMAFQGEDLLIDTQHTLSARNEALWAGTR